MESTGAQQGDREYRRTTGGDREHRSTKGGWRVQEHNRWIEYRSTTWG